MSYIQEAMLGTTPGDEPLVQQEDPPWTLTDKYWEDQWLISELEECRSHFREYLERG
jgi:hypothetical protein